MNIFILEDNKERIKKFKNKLNRKGVYLCIVETVEDAKRELPKENWDYVFLDHDLGGEIWCPSDEKSGYEVAKFIAENKISCWEIFIHSMNFHGAENMLHFLANHGYDVKHTPFSSIKF